MPQPRQLLSAAKAGSGSTPPVETGPCAYAATRASETANAGAAPAFMISASRSSPKASSAGVPSSPVTARPRRGWSRSDVARSAKRQAKNWYSVPGLSSVYLISR